MDMQSLNDLADELLKINETNFKYLLKEKDWISISNEIQTFVEELDNNQVLQQKLEGIIRGHAMPQGRENAKDIDDFGDVLSEIIDFYQDIENPVKDDNRITVRLGGSHIRMKNPVITWRVLNREPARVSKGSVHDRGTQEMAPRFRVAFRDPTRPNDEIHVYGQRFDNIIELEFATLDSNAFSAQMILLEKIMKNYSWFFSYKGFQRLTYIGRGEDRFRTHGGNTYFSGCLKYQVTTETLDAKTEPILRSLIVKLFLVDKYNKIVET